MDYLVPVVLAVGAVLSWVSIAVAVWLARGGVRPRTRLPRTRLHPAYQRVGTQDWPPFPRRGGSGAEL